MRQNDGVRDGKNFGRNLVPRFVAAVAPVLAGPATPPEHSCDPNYSNPCVPTATDVDCAGGRGDGPVYLQGPVEITVVGEDVYDVDRDKDGTACERPESRR